MKITKSDLEMFAARIRPHFEPELRETAYQLALEIAHVVGAKVKDLRPETALVELFAWLESHDPLGGSLHDSLDTVELSMVLEEEFGIDESGSPPRFDTFRDLVVHRARKRAA
jgi:hypothetical protein